MDVKRLQKHFPDSESWKSPFFFIQAADTQLGTIETYFEKKQNPGWSQEIALINKLIDKVNHMHPKPKFLIICGDMVNAMPGEKDHDAQVAEHKKLFQRLDKNIPLVCVCGNHDVGDEPTPQTIASYRKDFGPDYFSFAVDGVLMIVANSQYMWKRGKVPKLAAEFDQWFEKTLHEVKKYKHAIVFQHIPFFLDDPKEPAEYIDFETRMKYLNLLHKYGVKTVFSGHYHWNAGGRYKDIDQVVTTAVGAQWKDDKSGIRVVKVTRDSVNHKFYDLDSIPTRVSLLDSSPTFGA